MNLVQVIKNCLSMEKKLIAQLDSVSITFAKIYRQSTELTVLSSTNANS